jgi:hypothetical protein
MSSVPYWFLSQIHLEEEIIDEALEYARLALSQALANNETYIEAEAYVLIGACLDRKGAAKEAEASLAKGIRMLEDLSLKPYIGVANMYLAEFYRNRRAKRRADKAASLAYDAFSANGMSYWLARLLRSFPQLT